MKSQNKGCVRVILALIGVVLLCVGIYDESIMLMGAGVICLIFSLAGKKKQNVTSTEIRSGTTLNMPDNMTTTNASTLKSGTLNAYTYHKSVERTDHCPICKEFSGNGYCSKCGYRFNK